MLEFRPFGVGRICNRSPRCLTFPRGLSSRSLSGLLLCGSVFHPSCLVSQGCLYLRKERVSLWCPEDRTRHEYIPQHAMARTDRDICVRNILTFFSILRMTEAGWPSSFAGVHCVSVETISSTRAGRFLTRVAPLLRRAAKMSGLLEQQTLRSLPRREDARLTWSRISS